MTLLAIVNRSARTDRDSDGNLVYDVAFRVVDGLFAPAGSSESTGNGRDQVTQQPAVYLEHGERVDVDDAVVVPPVAALSVTADGFLTIPTGADGWPVGDRYEVDGQPVDWADPWSDWTPGVEVRLRKVSG